MVLRGYTLMPIITISALAQDIDRKREIVEVFTKEYSRITGVSIEAITILFQDLPADNISKNGMLLSDFLADKKA